MFINKIPCLCNTVLVTKQNIVIAGPMVLTSNTVFEFFSYLVNLLHVDSMFNKNIRKKSVWFYMTCNQIK